MKAKFDKYFTDLLNEMADAAEKDRKEHPQLKQKQLNEFESKEELEE